MNGTLVGDDIARARAYGIRLALTNAADRWTDPLPVDFPRSVNAAELRPATRDPRGPNACPTCDDGIRTIETPARCRACMKGGL